jgi:uncharacterized protein (TIGR03067 family)
MRHLCLALAALLWVVSAAIAEDKTPAEQMDLVKMQGEWKFEEITRRGRTEKARKVQTMKIEGTTMVRGKKQIVFGDEFTLNEKAKPKELDTEAEPYLWQEPLVTRGIYKLEGDRLTICFTIGPKSEPPTRPDTFEATNEQKDRQLAVFIRQK